MSFPRATTSLETLGAAANFLICIFHLLSFPVELSRDRVFPCVRSYRPPSKVTCPIWFFRCLDYPTKRPLSFLALINDHSLYSSASLDLVVSRSCCLLFSSLGPTVSTVFLFFYSSRFVAREFVYRHASHRPFASLFSPYLPEIVLFLSRDRLCHRLPSLLPDRLSPPVRSSRLAQNRLSSVLIFSGLFCFPYLLALLEPRLIRKHTPSLLPCFSRFLFFDLHCR